MYGYDEWEFYNKIIGTPHFTILHEIVACFGLLIGMSGWGASVRLSPTLGVIYYFLKLIEALINPTTGIMMQFEQEKIFKFIDGRDKELTTWIFINILKYFLLLYTAYLAKSFVKRIQRGEYILVAHGRGVLDLMSTISQDRTGNSMEMVAVKGVAADGVQEVPEGAQVTTS